jgi:hypothetical protein
MMKFGHVDLTPNCDCDHLIPELTDQNSGSVAAARSN